MIQEEILAETPRCSCSFVVRFSAESTLTVVQNRQSLTGVALARQIICDLSISIVFLYDL